MENIAKVIVVSFLFMMTNQSKIYAQLLPPCTDPNFGLNTSGTFNEFCNGTLNSNMAGIEYSTNANTDYRSATQIHLQTGFHAGEFNGTNKFHAYIDNPTTLTVVEPSSGPYYQLEKIEFDLELQHIHAVRNDYNTVNPTWVPLGVDTVDINDDINSFFSSSTYPNEFTNPYDQNDINIEVYFTHSSGEKFKTWAFYYEEFTHNLTDSGSPLSIENMPESWTSSGNKGWRVRFAPPLTGYYTVDVKITTYRNSPSYKVYDINNLNSFSVVNSSNDGYLQFADASSKYMSFSKNTSKTFVPVGYGTLGEHDFNRYTNTPAEFYIMRKYLENLEGRGNYARVNLSINYWIEFEDNPGNYDKYQTHMWELDQLLSSAEEKGIYLLFSLLNWEEFYHSPQGTLDAYRDADSNNSTRNLFGLHPYRNEFQIGDEMKEPGIIGSSDPLTAFFGNDDSRQLFKNRLQYIISRWGYSTHISAYDILGEIDNTIVEWDDVTFTRNFSTPAETNIVQAIYDWTGIMAKYIKDNDLNHLKTICKFQNGILPQGSSVSTDVFNVDDLDYIGFDDYGSKRNHNLLVRGNYIEDLRTETSLNPNLKPVEMIEMGGDDHRIVEMYSSNQMHNSYWSTAFSGMIGPGSYFYKQYISDIGLKKAENKYLSPAGPTIYDDYNSYEVGAPQQRDLDFWWPAWYDMDDNHTSVRKDHLTGNDIVGWDGAGDDITPDFTYELKILKEFMNDILPANGFDLQDGVTPQRYPDPINNLSDIESIYYANNNELEAFSLVTTDKSMATGWIHNRSNYWGNFDFLNAYLLNNSVEGFTYRCPSCPSPYTGPESYLYDGDDFHYPNNFPTPTDEQDDDINSVIEYNSGGMPTFLITGLLSNTVYTINWYNTETTNNVTGMSSPPGSPTTSFMTNSNGVSIGIIPPHMTNNDGHDYAFILSSNPSSRFGEEIAEEQPVLKSKINVVPNPNKGTFTLYFNNYIEGEIQVKIVNTIGSVILQKTIRGTNKIDLNIDDQPSGIYFVQVQTNNEFKVKRIIKN